MKYINETLPSKSIKDQKIIFYDLTEANLPDFLVEQYNILLNMYKMEEYYGALYQAKDFLELLIKMPEIILLQRICDYLLNNEEYTEQLSTHDLMLVKGILTKLLGKPLSLGDWESLTKDFATLEKLICFVGDEEVIYSGVFKQISLNKVALNNFKVAGQRIQVSTWRNKKLGHGAINTNKTELVPDIEAIIIAINDFLRKTSSKQDSLLFYPGLCFSYGNPKLLDSTTDKRLEGKFECPLVIMDVDCEDKFVLLSPFAFKLGTYNNENHILLLEGYDRRRNQAGVLDYVNGALFLENRLYQVLSMVEKKLRLDFLAETNIENEEISTETNENILDLVNVQKSEYIDNEYLNSLVINNLTDTSRMLWLQAERGFGKSVFALNVEFKGCHIFRYIINSHYNCLARTFSKQFCNFINNLNPSVTESARYSSARISFESKFNNMASVLERQNALKSFLIAAQEKITQKSLVLIIDGFDELPLKDESDVIDINIFLNKEIYPEGVRALLLSRTSEEYHFKVDYPGAASVLANCKALEYIKTIDKYLTKNIDRLFSCTVITTPEGKRQFAFSKNELVKLLLYKSGFKFVYAHALIKILTLFRNKYKLHKFSMALECMETFRDMLIGFESYEHTEVTTTSRSNEAFLNIFFKELQSYSKNYAQQVLKALILIAMIEDEISIKELSYLLHRSEGVRFKDFAILYDISPFVRLERTETRSVIKLSNLAWKKAVLDYDKMFTASLKEELSKWAEDELLDKVRKAEIFSPYKGDAMDLEAAINHSRRQEALGECLVDNLCNRCTSLLIGSFFVYEQHNSKEDALNFKTFCGTYRLDSNSDPVVLIRMLNMLAHYKAYEELQPLVADIFNFTFSVLKDKNQEQNLLESQVFDGDNVSNLLIRIREDIKINKNQEAVGLIKKAQVLCLKNIENYKKNFLEDNSRFMDGLGHNLQNIVWDYGRLCDLYLEATGFINNKEELINVLKKKISVERSFMDIRIKKINLICRRYENFDSNRKSAELYSYKEEISSHYTFLTDSATNIGKWGLKIFSLKEEPGIGLYYDFIMETWSYIREMMYFEMPNDGSVYIPPNVIINNQYVKFQLDDYYLSCCLLKEDYDKVFTLAEHALICKNVIASKLLPMLEQQKEFYQSVNMDKKSEEDEQCLKELENMCNVFLYKGFEASVKKKDISATEIIDKGSVFLEQVDQFSLEGFVKVAFTMLRCLALEKHLKNGEELDSLIEKLDSLVVNIMDNIDEEADTTLFCECHLSQIFINYLLVESKEDVSRKNNLVNLEELLDYLYQMYPLYENVNVLSLLELRVLNKVISLSCYHKDDTEKILNYVERIKSVGKYYRNNRDVQELTAALNAAGNYCYKGLLDIPRKFSFFSDAIGVIEDIYAMNNIELTNSEIRSLWKRGQKLNESKWFLQGRVFAGQSEL